jgi:translation elongation factor TU
VLPSGAETRPGDPKIRDSKCIFDADGRGRSLHPAAERREIDKPFLMPIEDVFSIRRPWHGGDGSCRALAWCKVGDEVEIVGITRQPATTTVTGVEMFQQAARRRPGWRQRRPAAPRRGPGGHRAWPGAGCKPGSIKPHTKFKAQVYVLTKEEGGRHTPFFNGYRPQFYFRTTDVTGIREARSAPRCACLATTSRSSVEFGHGRSRWTSVSASRSAKAAAPSAPVVVTKILA